MSDVGDHGSPAPPAGEEIHLPGASLLPLIMAVGITLVVIGTTVNLLFSAVGLVIFLITLVRWVRSTRRDIGELPEEHRH